MEASREIMNDMSSTAKKTAHDLKGEAKSKINEVRGNLKDAFNERYETVRGQAKEAIHQSEDFVKEHPLSTVLGAAAVGFIAGALLRRRH